MPKPQKNLIFQQPETLVAGSYGTPLDRHPAGKIVVFGLPKSGNVWLVSLLSDYCKLPPCDPWHDVDKPGVGMNHYAYTEKLSERLDFLHGIYLIRDIRDVIVSYFHYAQTSYFKESVKQFHYETLDKFYFEWFLARDVPLYDIYHHADGYMKFGLPVIRYEKLWDDPVGEFGRLIKRLGLPFDQQRVEAAVANNRLELLKKQGRMINGMVPPSHFRKGGYGNYKDEMPPHILAHVNAEFGHILAGWGYELGVRESIRLSVPSRMGYCTPESRLQELVVAAAESKAQLEADSRRLQELVVAAGDCRAQLEADSRRLQELVVAAGDRRAQLEADSRRLQELIVAGAECRAQWEAENQRLQKLLVMRIAHSFRRAKQKVWR